MLLTGRDTLARSELFSSLAISRCSLQQARQGHQAWQPDLVNATSVSTPAFSSCKGMSREVKNWALLHGTSNIRAGGRACVAAQFSTIHHEGCHQLPTTTTLCRALAEPGVKVGCICRAATSHAGAAVRNKQHASRRHHGPSLMTGAFLSAEPSPAARYMPLLGYDRHRPASTSSLLLCKLQKRLVFSETLPSSDAMV